MEPQTYLEDTVEVSEGVDDMITKETAAESTANTPNGSIEITTSTVTLPDPREDRNSHSNLEAALSSAQRGWPVFPIFEIQDGQCACEKAECSSPGKHPRTRNGVKDATIEVSQIKAWWTQWPEANIGIATGEASGFLVLDVDPQHGGKKSLEELEQQHGSLPYTVEAITGGKGRHLYFGRPQGATIGNSVSKLGSGLDIRSTGGYIVAPPSHHISGGQYVWKTGHSPEELDLAEVPDWLVKRLQTRDQPNSPVAITDGKIKEGQRNDTLFKIGCCLRGKGLEQEAIEAQLLLVNGLQCVPPLEAAEIRTIAASAALYAINTQGDEQTWLPQMNDQHAVIRVGGKTVILNHTYDPILKQKDITLSAPTDLTHWYKNQSVPINGRPTNLAKAWMEHENRRQYQGIAFSPKQEVPGYFNLWQGFAVEAKEGDCGLYLEHIKDNIAQGDEKVYGYVLGWMAQCIQEPDKRPGVAIVLRGKQGTGKGVFVTQFGKLFGKHFSHVTNPKHLLGNFNAHLKDALLVFADEAFWAGDKANEGVLKSMVTEDQLPIEYKGKDVFYVQNHIHLLIASNQEWVVPAGLEERRFCMLDVGDQHMQDHRYFEQLVQQMEHGGREALLHYLLNYDLSGVNLKEFPQTQALLDTKLLSMSSVEQFWYGRLQDGSIRKKDTSWETAIRKQDVHEAYIDWVGGSGQSKKSCQTELGMGLKKLVPGLQDITRTVDGNREQCWIFPDLVTCREHFNQITKCQHDWPNEEK